MSQDPDPTPAGDRAPASEHLGTRAATPSPRRRAVRPFVLGAASMLAAGLLATGAGVAVASAANAATPEPTSTTTPAPAHGSGAGCLPDHHRVRGTIASLSGSTWTITTPRGRTETVTTDSSTAYGRATAPASASSFHTGEGVVVVGRVAKGGITARRILEHAKPTVTAAPTPKPTATPGAGSGTTRSGAGRSGATGTHHRHVACTAGARVERGTIASISGSTWTITTPRGATDTVMVDSSTKYGRGKTTATVSSFRAGQNVVVIGREKDGSLDARRIVQHQGAFGTGGHGARATSKPAPTQQG